MMPLFRNIVGQNIRQFEFAMRLIFYATNGGIFVHRVCYFKTCLL